jgi:hypothetical protein
MTYVDVPVNVFLRFSLERFCITPDLISAKHEFVFEGRPVTLSLPGLDKDTVPPEQRRIECHKWKSVGNIPLEYNVNSLDIEMELGDTIRVPEPVRHLHPNQFELFKPHEQKNLDQTVAEAGTIVRRAFEYWLRMLRWKSGIGYIGEPSIRYAGAHEGGAVLRDRLSGHRMWLQPHVIRAVGSRPVTTSQWDATQVALTACKLPPVWFEFLFDSEMRINNNDLVGAVLSLAIALEVNVRTIFSHDLRTADIEPVMLEIFDQTNLRALLNRIKKMRRWDKEWEKATDLSEINSLMNYRDRVMHSAQTENLDEVELRKMHAAVKKFAYFTCDHLGLS